MKIILSPQASNQDDSPPTVHGEVLTYRGQSYNLTQLPDGAEVQADEPFLGVIKRINGIVHCTLQYRYNWETSEDHQSLDWADYTFDVTHGQCPCPIKRKPVPTEKEDEIVSH